MPATALRPETESTQTVQSPELQDLDWQTVAPLPVSYTHLTLPTNREV